MDSSKQQNILVELKNITKKFGALIANDKVNLSIEKGEIHALVGENGAGKTTLMNVFYGLYQPDFGKIYLNGTEIHMANPKTAISLGIGMVHQHFMLIPPLTVAENIVLGEEPGNFLTYNKSKAISEVQQISEKHGLNVDPAALVSTLSVGTEQRVEILKLLYRRASILIFDEPTAVLTPQETKDLFRIFNSLKKEGKTIVFISHKLKEVMEISDRITVMRQGKTVGVLVKEKTSEAEIARLMVGRDVLFIPDKEVFPKGDVVLEVQNLQAVNDRHLPALQGVSFTVKAGEILGVAGVAGNGQTELAEVLTGLRSVKNGKIFLKGQDVTQDSPGEKIKLGIAHILGIAHVPEDRHKRGLILDFPVAYNLILGSQNKLPFSKNLILDSQAIQNFAKEKIVEFDIRPGNENLPARYLSGGNQQKVVIAREFSRDPSFLVISQPTRGVDVGGIEFIHHQILSMKKKGKAILLISLELDEILNLSDRIAVLYNGKIMKILERAAATEEQLGLLMAGISEYSSTEKS